MSAKYQAFGMIVRGRRPVMWAQMAYDNGCVVNIHVSQNNGCLPLGRGQVIINLSSLFLLCLNRIRVMDVR